MLWVYAGMCRNDYHSTGYIHRPELWQQKDTPVTMLFNQYIDDLINELETDYNGLCKQIKQTEQEISELNGQIAENY